MGPTEELIEAGAHREAEVDHFMRAMASMLQAEGVQPERATLAHVGNLVAELAARTERAELRRAADQAELERLRGATEQLDWERDDKATKAGATAAVLQTLLQRPHRLMEIYGIDVYQAAKDCYMLVGGDPGKIPHPEVNAAAEAAAKASKADANG